MHEDLDLTTVYLLDQVQKGKRISKEAAAHLRKYHFVEGRVTNLYLAAPLAKTPEEKTQYIKNKAFDDQYYRDLIIKYLQQYGKAKRAISENCFGTNFRIRCPTVRRTAG